LPWGNGNKVIQYDWSQYSSNNPTFKFFVIFGTL
jgi:hypothetical protein